MRTVDAMTGLYLTQPTREDFSMHIAEEEFDSVIELLNFVYHPTDYGCAIDFGDASTRAHRVDHIIDDANATVTAILARCAGGKDDWTARCLPA
jgi:hypothetical protein